MYSAVEEDVHYALDKEMNLWREAALNALNNCFNNSAQLFKESPQECRAAAAFSFVKEATENLFPASAGAELLQRCSVPLWITTQAVEVFNAQYAKEAQDANKLLSMDYKVIRESFGLAIHSIERTFLNKPAGEMAAGELLRLVEGRSFEGPIDAKTHLRVTIAASGIVNASLLHHERQMQASLGRILAKVKAVYAGSAFGPGRTGLYLIRWKDAVCGADIQRFHRIGRGLKVDDLDVTKKFQGPYEGELAAVASKFKGQAECVIPLTTVNLGNFGAITGRDTARKILANIDRYEVFESPSQLGVFGTHETFVWKPTLGPRRTSVQSLAGTINGPLNEKSLGALRDAERKTWQARGQ